MNLSGEQSLSETPNQAPEFRFAEMELKFVGMLTDMPIKLTLYPVTSSEVEHEKYE